MNKLITLIDEGGIICPLPTYWNRLYNIIVKSLHPLESKGLVVPKSGTNLEYPHHLSLEVGVLVMRKKKKGFFCTSLSLQITTGF